MALKNEENKDIIDVLRQYYKDMVDIATSSKDSLYKNNVKYVLSFETVEGTVSSNEKYSFVFTNENKLIEFYEKYKHKGEYISVLEMHDIDPENNFRPNFETHIDTWLHNKNNK